jgi:micrococcal nuclease
MAFRRGSKITTRNTIALFLLALIVAPAYAAKGTISGTCRVVDGDTIWVDSQDGSTEVRLSGVAAPEKKEPGGKQATEFLKTVCEGQPVRCELNGSKTRGREVGICYVNDADIGAAVIDKGLARDCTRFSGGRYAGLEKPEAKHLAFPGYCSPR